MTVLDRLTNQTSHDLKVRRQRAIRDLVATHPIRSQREVVDALSAGGFDVTQATVSRDISELGLQRILGDIPVTIGRSALILVLTGTPGTASVIAQAIDESSLREQEGTLAGDNTLLVLCADASRLERWLERFESIQSRSGGSRIP